MKARTPWILAAAGLLGLLVIADLVRSVTSPRPVPSRTTVVRNDPAFRAGDEAPEFALPDQRGKQRRLSELAKEDTLLAFSCGCSYCRDLQSYLGQLQRLLKERAPRVVSVSTMPVEQEAAWKRETRLEQTILYEKRQGPVVAQYRGHPCPRFYRLRPGRTVAWLGSSPKDLPQLDAMGHQLAEQLGFVPPGQGGKGRLEAPLFEGTGVVPASDQ